MSPIRSTFSSRSAAHLLALGDNQEQEKGAQGPMERELKSTLKEHPCHKQPQRTSNN